MKIKLKTNIKDFYKDVFNVLNTNFLQLKPKELEVLAALYQSNLELFPRIADDKLRMNILFSRDSKLELCEKLNISYYSLMNNISSLRKKEYIKDNMLDKKLYFNPTNFNIIIEVDAKTGTSV